MENGDDKAEAKGRDTGFGLEARTLSKAKSFCNPNSIQKLPLQTAPAWVVCPEAHTSISLALVSASPGPQIPSLSLLVSFPPSWDGSSDPFRKSPHCRPRVLSARQADWGADGELGCLLPVVPITLPGPAALSQRSHPACALSWNLQTLETPCRGTKLRDENSEACG